jgi:hypothetical protein
VKLRGTQHEGTSHRGFNGDSCRLVALLALPAYFTGEPAEEAVERAVGVTEQVIDAHEAAALVSLVGVELLGVIASAGCSSPGAGGRCRAP